MLKNLFIFSSKIPKAFVFCLCILILLMAGINKHFEINSDIKEVDELLHRNSKNVDYIFLGDSSIRSNINEEALNKIETSEFVNFGFGGATSVPLYFILNRFLSNNPDMKIHNCIIGLAKQHLVDIYSTRPREYYVTRVLTFHEFWEIRRDLPEDQIQSYYLSKIIPSYGAPPQTIYFWNIYKNRVYKYPGFEVSMRGYNDITSEHLAFRDLSELNLKYTEKIIEFCLSNDIHIQLLIIPLPRSIYEEHLLLNPNAFKKMDNFIDHLCKKYQVELIQMPRVLEDSKFQDSDHLNRKGSIYYTELLVEKITQNKD